MPCRSRRRGRHDAHDVAHHLARDVLFRFRRDRRCGRGGRQFVSEQGTAHLGRSCIFRNGSRASLRPSGQQGFSTSSTSPEALAPATSLLCFFNPVEARDFFLRVCFAPSCHRRSADRARRPAANRQSMMGEPPRRFPPPWTVEETAPCFIVRDKNAQALAFVYCEDDPGRRTTAKLLTRDEARRIAANIAKLAEPLQKP